MSERIQEIRKLLHSGLFSHSMPAEKVITELCFTVDSLLKENKELHQRPEFIAIDIERENKPHIEGTRFRYRVLLAGQKYKIHVKYEKGESFRFETPMMCVETPKVIVYTDEYHTWNKDHIIATRMENKE